MRWKIIVVNAGIVLVVGVLAYVFLYTSLRDLLIDPAQRKRELERGLAAARAELALDAVRRERWLAERAAADSVRALFTQGVRDTRADAATLEANRLRDAAGAEPELARATPALVLFVDAQGIALARNASTLMRGENIAQVYPSLTEVLREGSEKSAVWYSRDRQEQMLVSIAPIRDGGRILGAVVLGTAVSDERLTRMSELTSGQPLAFGVVGDGGLEVLASSASAAALPSSPALGQAATAALSSGGFAAAEVDADDMTGVIALSGYAGRRAVLLGRVPAPPVNPASLLNPLLGVVGLGLLLVIIAGVLLGNYISEPVSELEDGLLAIINGQSSLRFQIEHDELGGLVFRINSLLNALMGVPEDTTDEQGRPSQGPRAQDFQDALSVDERAVLEQTDPGVSVALSAEPADAYYERLFREYIAARKQLGDPTDHITAASFRERIRQSELEMTEKHGRPVRFAVQLKNQAIILNAIPLGSGDG